MSPLASPTPLNLGVLAHVDAGKTSLTERLLFEAGVIADPGSVDAGTTVTDTMALERRRGITIRSAVASFVVDGRPVNLVDTPGHSDFIAEVERALAVLDGVVLVVSGTEGVQAQTLVLFRALQRLRIPTLFFVNKMDRPGAQPDAVLDEIAARLTSAVVRVGGVVPPDPPSRLADVLAEHDTEVLAALVGERAAYPPASLHRRLAEQTARSQAHPVVFGSAITGAGVSDLTLALTTYLPPPHAELEVPASGLVFKVERGASGERITHLRMGSGVLRVRERVDLGHGRVERVTAVSVYSAHGLVTANALSAGQIGQVRGLATARIGDVVGEWTGAVAQEQFVRPSLETVVDPVDDRRRGDLYSGLAELAEQDPLIDVRQDDGRREVSVSLYGEVQKEVIGSRPTTASTSRSASPPRSASSASGARERPSSSSPRRRTLSWPPLGYGSSRRRSGTA